jgi:hypothetical protein
MTGPGRRPEVDFAVADPYPKIRFAVESKWIGNTSVSAQSILWDLIRLELIAYAENADCFFVLGGQRRALEAFFRTEAFAGPARSGPRHPLLRVDTNHVHSIPLVPTVRHRIPVLKRIFEPYQDFAFPHKITTNRSAPCPARCTLNQFQVYTWRIRSPARRNMFYPRNSSHYVV